jgi:DNA primase
VAYSRDDIDKVRERTDLAELAAEVTKVKRSGRSVMAVCPFHQEKTPSLSIDPGRGLFHCFGCGKSGDVFGWVQETQGVDFVGALELLARRAGVALTEDPEARKRRGQREQLIAAVAAAVDFYHERLRSGDDAGEARSYLRGRGYDGDVVSQFQLGYSPSEWNELADHLKAAGVREDTMVTAGLASRSRTGRLVDRFRGRIMFPIYDLRGDPVGFGARLLEGDGPKYLNSPETPIYHKSRLLYALNWSKSAIVRTGEAVVVEGYTDVIAFHIAGNPVAVATCGTALGEEHLDLLRRFTERVVLSFDADEAGAGAALRGFEKAIPGDLDLRVAALPEGRDPADIVMTGETEALRKAVADSIPLLQFRLEQDLSRFDLHEAEARARAVRAVAPLIAQHPDPVVRHEYAVMLSKRTGVDLDVVERAIRRRPTGDQPPPPEPEFGVKDDHASPERLSGLEKAERELLRVWLANPLGLARDDVPPDLFSRDDHRHAFEMIAPAVLALEPGEPPNLGALVGTNDSSPARMLRRIAMDGRPLQDPDALMNRLKVGRVERRIDRMRSELAALDPEADAQVYSGLFAELIALERQRRQLRLESEE